MIRLPTRETADRPCYRALEAGDEIMKLCIESGGSLTGEHGVGLEKLAAMEWLFSPSDLAAMCRARDAWDPERRMNPGKLLPVRACVEARPRTSLAPDLREARTAGRT